MLSIIIFGSLLILSYLLGCFSTAKLIAKGADEFREEHPEIKKDIQRLSDSKFFDFFMILVIFIK